MARSLFLEYLSMARTRKAKETVKVASKQPVQICLTCDEPAQPGCRGKCKKCLNQFDYEKRKKAKGIEGKRRREEAMNEYDKQEQNAGRIFPPRPGRKKVERKKTA